MAFQDVSNVFWTCVSRRAKKQGSEKMMTPKDRPALQLKVKGPGVRGGRIPIPDLIILCQEAQNAVNKQAESLEGRKTMHPGPVSQAIQNECTLELVGLKKGSTVLQFGFVKPQLMLPFEDENVLAFGASVVTHLTSTIQSLVDGNDAEEIAPGVLSSLYAMSGLVESERITSIDWIAPRGPGRNRAVSVPISAKVHERVAQRLSTPRRAFMVVSGILDMADFKPKERKCRIDPAIGTSIMCTFAADLEDKVYELMRRPVRASGQAKLRPYTDRIDVLHITEMYSLPSLSLGEKNFFASKSLEVLASEQAVKPLSSVSSLIGGIAQDEDIDAFLDEIYSARNH